MGPEYYRSTFLAQDIKRDEGLTPPDDIKITRGISYSCHGDETIMDIYCPKTGQEPFPVIVSVHGGGWVYGSIIQYQYYCMSLVQRGFAAVNFNYRLAPETQFPGMIEDLNTLMGWILENGREYGLDTDNIFMVGDSAGAQLASQYVAAVSNKEYAKLFPFEIPDGLKIRACALNCGVFDVKSYVLSVQDAPIRYYIPDLTDEIIECMDAIKYITDNYPPTFVMSANKDFLLESAQPMYDLLRERGVEAQIHIYGSEDNPKEHVFHLNVRDEMGKKCNDDECEFFKQHLSK